MPSFYHTPCRDCDAAAVLPGAPGLETTVRHPRKSCPSPSNPRLWQGRIVAAPLFRFVGLYVAMYAAFGVISPFLPRFLQSRGLTPEQIGIFFGAGTAVRLLSAPAAGRIADLSGALRTVLAVCVFAATG